MRRSLHSLMIVLLTLATVSACGEKEGDEREEREERSETAAAQPAGGEKIYQQRCVTCHQPNGLGTPGVFPPLAGSEYVTAADPGVPIRVVLHGLQGAITVSGAEYNSLMPAYGVGIVMSDAEVASVLTYVRTSWGNTASAVTAEDVEHAREATKDHIGAMTADLLKPLLKK